MTIAELIERLEDARDELGEDAEVRLMMQPSWPFEYSIGGSVSSNEIGENNDEDGPYVPEGGEAVFYLVEGSQLAYGTSDAFDAAN